MTEPPSRRAPLVDGFIIAFSLALALPSLGSGLVNDDYLQRARLSGRIPGLTRDPWSLYDFIGRSTDPVSELVAQGTVPWWTAPGLTLAFLRPISSSLLALDVGAFGESTALAHAHSLVWFLLLLVLARRLFMTWLPPGARTFAFAVYALSASHTHGSIWLAARHVVVGGVFGLLALISFTQASLPEASLARRTRSATAALGWLLLGLLSSEIALGAIALMVAFELGGPASEPARARFRRLLPPLGLALVYLAAYRALGYGAKQSGGYLDLFGGGVWAIGELGARVLALLANALLGVPADLYLIVREARLPLALLGAIGCLFVGVLTVLAKASIPRALERRALALAGGGIVAAGAGALGMVGGRVLVLGGLSAAFVLGLLFHGLREQLRVPDALRGFARPVAWQGLVVLALVHFLGGPLVRLATAETLASAGKVQHALGDRTTGVCARHADPYLLHAPDPGLGLYAGALLVFAENAPFDSIQVLSMAPGSQRLTALGARRFRLEPLESAFLEAPFEQLFRAPTLGHATGDSVRIRNASVTIVDTNERREPTAIELEVDPGRTPCFLLWRDGALVAVETPESGRASDVESTQGPLGL